MATVVNNSDGGSSGGWVVAIVVVIIAALVAVFVWPGFGRTGGGSPGGANVDVSVPAPGGSGQ